MKACAIALSVLFLSLSAKAEFPEPTFTQPAAASKQTAPTIANTTPLRQGLRIAFVKPVLTMKSKVTVEGMGSGSGSEKVDSSNGVSVGYAYLPIKSAGFTTNLALINLKEEGDDSYSMIRADGNLAYAINPMVNFKGGVNLSTFNKSEFRKDFRPQVGLQASAGFQLNRNFGIDLGYASMNQQSKTIDGVSMSLQESGPELSLTGTF